MTKNIQFFDWGQIEWIYEPEKSNHRSVMNIGIITIYPGKKQNKHIHYGDEQLIYILSGKGEQLIDNETTTTKPGSIFHIEAGSTHETTNAGDKPLKELLISIPASYEQEFFLKSKGQKIENEEIYPENIRINNEIEYLFQKIIVPLKIPVTVFDNEGKIVTKTNCYPEFCKTNCNVDENVYSCTLYNISDEYTPPQYTDFSAFICPFGLTVFVIPIVYNNEIIGVIKGGHIRESQNSIKIDKKEYMNYVLYSTPKGTVNAILQIMKRFSKNIVNYYIFRNTEIELNKKDEIIKDIVKNEIMLEESLRTTQGKVLNIQMNNHFLFNTLNAIASLAIKENSYNTYNAIINLSKMFRYSLKNSSYFVELRDEIEYLKNYINLQKIRYGNKLTTDFHISLEVENVKVPFNFLQPAVENCFKHGFKDVKDNMKIVVTAKSDDDMVIIEIKDNGTGIKQDDLNDIKSKIVEHKKYTLSGLMMSYSKLEMFYGDNFLFNIKSLYKKGTMVEIHLPDKII